MKNKIAVLLMEAGVSYNKQKLHKVGYFRELLATNQDIDDGLRSLLRLCRETVVRLGKTENALVRSLERDPLLVERVERLMTIPAVGPITALTWALEVGDVQRFSSIKKAISYCGLCGAEKSSANIIKRTPLSKQRNKHLQTMLIEAAKMAPRNSPDMAMVYDKEKQKGNANRATLAVARKLVAYLVAVDRRQKDFLTVEREKRTARSTVPKISGGFLQRAACQVLPLIRLGKGAQALEAHFRFVSRLAGEHKLNLLWRPCGAETANGCLVLDRAGTTAERHERELKALKNSNHVLLQSASGELLPS
jgi:hypothetical protein